MLPSVFDNGRTESAAGDLDVEAGMDEARGRLPGIGNAQAGQGVGDGAEVLNEGAKEKVPALTKTQKRNQQKYRALAAARDQDGKL